MNPPQETSEKEALPKILVIDDDRKLAGLIKDYLEPLGYDVTTVHTGPDGVTAATGGSWQAVILDVMLPGMDGFEVLRKIRATSDVPVLMLTARGEETDRIVGLEIGADDYLPKTFSTRELLARLRAVTRRSRSPQPNTPPAPEEFVVGALRIRPSARLALLDETPMTLTPVEFDLLVCLARNKGKVRSREQLLDEIRAREYEIFDRSIDVHISALRRKLGDDAKHPRYIKTFRAAGYMLGEPEETP